MQFCHSNIAYISNTTHLSPNITTSTSIDIIANRNDQRYKGYHIWSKHSGKVA
jgi:hypothetical protein